MKHTFSICAYEESPYLEACIRSVRASAAAAGSEVIVCTSTPNGHIRGLAERYGLPLYVRTGPSSLRDDWNFAVQTAVTETKAQLVTVAHQDDLYHREYAAILQKACRQYPDLMLFCTRVRTVGPDGQPLGTRAEQVKRLLRLPLSLRKLSHLNIIKRLPLILGNGIACPSCTYNTALCGLPLFEEDRSFTIDWETLLRLADRPGRFVCVERELLDYRVHGDAATKKNILNHNREAEEAAVFGRIWPKRAAALLMHFYKLSYRDYA